MRNMTDKETAQHLREWVKTNHATFAWPTDACGYEQHIKFVEHRNKNWNGSSIEEFNKFILDYADSLDACDELEKMMQKTRNAQIRPKKRWWHIRKKVYCTECKYERGMQMEMFGVVTEIPICGKAEKDGGYKNRYRKNKSNNCKDFEVKDN